VGGAELEARGGGAIGRRHLADPLPAAVERVDAGGAARESELGGDAVDFGRARAPVAADRSAGVVPLHAAVGRGTDSGQKRPRGGRDRPAVHRRQHNRRVVALDGAEGERHVAEVKALPTDQAPRGAGGRRVDRHLGAGRVAGVPHRPLVGRGEPFAGRGRRFRRLGLFRIDPEQVRQTERGRHHFLERARGDAGERREIAAAKEMRAGGEERELGGLTFLKEK